jgi:uncharacterized membrane protein YtjA (UPF0391 family)
MSLALFCIRRETTMLYWSLVFLAIALVAGVLGFGALSATAAGIAKVLFAVFLVLFLVSLLAGRSSFERLPPAWKE